MPNFTRPSLRRIFHEDVGVASAIPGEAPSQVSDQPVITEPSNGAGTDSIYELYPDLAQVDISSPCTLADFFASLCEEDQQNQAAAAQAKIVPSMTAVDTQDEFA